MTIDELTRVIDDAIDWDFVEVFPGETDDPGYASEAAFCSHLARSIQQAARRFVGDR